MGMKLADIEIGKEYRAQYPRGRYGEGTTRRLRAEAIEQVTETNTWGRTSGRKVRHVRYTPLDEETGEVHPNVAPGHIKATQLIEPWDVYAERQAAAKRRESAHEALVQRLDGVFSSIGVTAVRYGEARHTEAPSIAIVLTHEMAEKLAKAVEG